MSKSQRNILRGLGSQFSLRITKSTATNAQFLGQKHKDPPQVLPLAKCFGPLIIIESNLSSASSNTAKGKGTIVYSSGKKQRIEVSREVLPLGDQIPEDLAAFLWKI